ncbi:MAG: signal peptidase I [Lachnospiraceae bacterium]|jgi:signal peptidase I|nr:signal peptidase I [Lachnospiraceae bacterium]
MDFFVEKETNLLRHVVNWVTDIIVAIALAYFTVYAFGSQVTVSGNSMSPLLNSNDVVLINQLGYDLGTPSRFDVVVFEREDHKRNIKRIIGLPGETVQIIDGQIYINGQLLELEGLPETKKIALAGLAENPVELGADEYFLLGDNRDSSEDSRFSNVGNVKGTQIIGKVWFQIYPTMEFGRVQ